ncbi:MAG TPA: large conductance mechanosensitive channel protein MscL [Novosphingobium sp.]|nr:large conductance mechanosensitive channel protein MscL [Novosphingobium sp.]
MAIMQEFKTFIARGNVLDLAVGVIIGAAFGKIVTSLTESVIMPVVGWLTGGTDFTRYFIRLGELPSGYKGSVTDYAALKAAGVPMIGYGDFITQLVNFLIVAWIIFLMVKAINRFMAQKEAEATPAGPSEVELLAEIRDQLKRRSAP